MDTLYMAEGEGSTKVIYRFQASGNVYMGGWRGNQRHGKGKATYCFSHGATFTGVFVKDHAKGKGRIEYANGNVYEGHFVNAEKHGSGVYRWQNGSAYKGEFTHGLIAGRG